MSTNTRGHLSSETIDLLLLSALNASEATSAKAHLATCTVCGTRWQEVNEDKQRFEQFVFARTLPKVEAAVEKNDSMFSKLNVRWLMPVLGLVTAGVAAFIIHAALVGLEPEPYVGVKGQAPMLEVFAMRDEGRPFSVKRGQALKPKDRIRFVVNPPGAKYVLIASRDAKGTFTVYHPFGASQSQKVPGDDGPKKVELSSTIELDDTAGPERLVAVFSAQPVAAHDVEAALLANPDSPSVPNAQVVSWEFVKEPN